MIKKLLILFIIAFVAGILFSLLSNPKSKITLKENKNCTATINACAKDGICGPQVVKLC